MADPQRLIISILSLTHGQWSMADVVALYEYIQEQYDMLGIEGEIH